MSESTALTQSRIKAAAATIAAVTVEGYMSGKADNTSKAQEQYIEAFAMLLENVTSAVLDLQNLSD